MEDNVVHRFSLLIELMGNLNGVKQKYGYNFGIDEEIIDQIDELQKLFLARMCRIIEENENHTL